MNENQKYYDICSIIKNIENFKDFDFSKSFSSYISIEKKDFYFIDNHIIFFFWSCGVCVIYEDLFFIKENDIEIEKSKKTRVISPFIHYSVTFKNKKDTIEIIQTNTYPDYILGKNVSHNIMLYMNTPEIYSFSSNHYYLDALIINPATFKRNTSYQFKFRVSDHIPQKFYREKMLNSQPNFFNIIEYNYKQQPKQVKLSEFLLKDKPFSILELETDINTNKTENLDRLALLYDIDLKNEIIKMYEFNEEIFKYIHKYNKDLFNYKTLEQLKTMGLFQIYFGERYAAIDTKGKKFEIEKYITLLNNTNLKSEQIKLENLYFFKEEIIKKAKDLLILF